MQGGTMLDYDVTQDVRGNSSYTYTDSEQKTGEFAGEPLNKIPEHMFNLAVYLGRNT